MCKTMDHAVRAFERLAAQVAASFEMAYEYDSHFDGGEFSGPHLAKAERKAYDGVLHLVASRFGVDEIDLEIAIYEKEQFEMDCYREALGGVPHIYA